MSNEPKLDKPEVIVSGGMKFERWKLKPGQEATIRILDDLHLGAQYWVDKDGKVELRSMSVVQGPPKKDQK